MFLSPLLCTEFNTPTIFSLPVTFYDIQLAKIVKLQVVYKKITVYESVH